MSDPGRGFQVEVLHDDALAVMGRMPSGCVDAVIVDPPWNFGKRYGRHDDAMPDAAYAGWLASAVSECARLARGTVVLMTGRHNVPRLPRLLWSAGLRPVGVVVWRTRGSRAAAAEPVVVTRRAAARGVRVTAPPLLITPEPHPADEALGRHPCPKPVPLMRRLVELAAPPRGVVLDPFAGTGATLVAARDAGRAALGIELEERFCRIAERRLALGR